MSYTKEAEWLESMLQSSDIAIADCRFQLGNSRYGKEEYMKGHIPGAVYFDLEQDLSGPAGQHGGRHPLPKMEDIKEKLASSGFGTGKTVIAYDNGEGAFAARFWWLLTYMGHRSVYILNGGYTNWARKGLPVTAEMSQPERSPFLLSIQENMLASYDEVKKMASGGDGVLIDSRAHSRYIGAEEPLDKRAGHIPGALNYEWTDGLTDGFFKPGKEQAARFQKLNPDEEIVVYCGSGVTATPNFLALKEAGFSRVRLYAGSYSDWVSYPNNPVETGDGQD